jgi:hypothetical protein
VPLKDATVVTDLGINMGHKLRFANHYASIVKKAYQRCSLILRCFSCRDSSFLSKAFTVYVRPLLDYCSPVWSSVYIGDINLLESVQRGITNRLSGMCGLLYLQRLQRIRMETFVLRRQKTDPIMMIMISNK